MENKDTVNGKGLIKLDKYRKPEDMDEEIFLKLIDTGQANPYETKTGTNIFLTVGWTEILKLITGASTSHFDSTNATIGVGDSATAAAAGQTDLIGSNKKYKGMSSGYPTVPATGTVVFKARFLTSEANYTWAELVLKNSASVVSWNRKATGWGTKTATEVWNMTLTLGVA